MKNDQQEFFIFVKKQHTWHKRLYNLHKGWVMNRPPVFLDHTLGDQPTEEKQHQDEKPARKYKP